MFDILVVDDEPAIRNPLGELLREKGYRVTLARDGAEALSRLDSQVFNLVVTDVRMPGVDGFSLLRRLRKNAPDTDIVLMTAFGSIPDAMVAVRERAVDYLTKPFDFDDLVSVVERIAERQRMTREFDRLRGELGGRRASDHIVGGSPQTVRLREELTMIADSTASVLLTGESGTGKELAARMIHALSPRRKRPFVALNCAAIPANLMEAELFGHERGAFTGATKRREGRLKAADGGTLLLDEIGELPLELQPKLLRALQEGSFEPVGSNTPVHVDVRLVSATNRDLRADVEEGRFRQDLYYRIRVFDVRIPPLRERRGDLPLLVTQFLAEFTPAGEKPPALSPEAWATLEHYAFPGNVRELKHAIQHATILARGGNRGKFPSETPPPEVAPLGNIEVAHLPPDLRLADAQPEVEPWSEEAVRPLPVAIEQYEREYLARTLRLAGGERKKAAEMLGISRKSLWKKIVRYGLKE